MNTRASQGVDKSNADAPPSDDENGFEDVSDFDEDSFVTPFEEQLRHEERAGFDTSDEEDTDEEDMYEEDTDEEDMYDSGHYVLDAMAQGTVNNYIANKDLFAAHKRLCFRSLAMSRDIERNRDEIRTMNSTHTKTIDAASYLTQNIGDIRVIVFCIFVLCMFVGAVVADCTNNYNKLADRVDAGFQEVYKTFSRPHQPCAVKDVDWRVSDKCDVKFDNPPTVAPEQEVK